MELFRKILCEINILTEAVEINDINDAIKNLQKARIKYNDEEGTEGKGERLICPVAYGISTKGNPVVRAFQISGDSKRGSNEWKLFKLSNITDWESVNNEKYDASKLVGFNKDGDKQMEIIYSIAPIGNAKDIKITKMQGMPEELTSGPVSKSYVNNSGSKNAEELERQKQEMLKNTEKVDNNNYTANNAINDVLKTATNYSVTKNDENIDNDEESSYNTKNNSLKVEPIKQSEIPGGDKIVSGKEDNTEPDKTIADDPIKKDDINGSDSGENAEDVKNQFNDMMNRMNGTKNEENDEEEK